MVLPSPPLPAVDQYWAQYLGGDPADLYVEGVRLVAQPALSGLTAVARAGAVGALGADLHPAVGARLLRAFLDGRGQPAAVREHDLAAASRAAALPQHYGPTMLAYRTSPPDAPPVPPGTCRLSPADQPALEHFLRALGEPREYRADDQKHMPYVIATVDADRLLAVAAMRVWGGVIGEVFIDVLPEARGRGWATALAGAAARWAVAEAGLIAQYDTEWTNAASMAVGQRLGFAPYAEFFSARPLLPATAAGPCYSSEEKALALCR